MSRLGVYVDTVYRADGDEGEVRTNSESLAFLRFAAAVGASFDGLWLFGREDPGGAGADHPVGEPAELIPLPYYQSLMRGFQVLRAAPGTISAMWRGLVAVDCVWVFGPTPFSLALVALARLRGRRVVLGVRQDSRAYFRNRLPSRLVAPILIPFAVADKVFRLLSRRMPTTVVGGHVERQYGGPRRGLLALQVSLVPASGVPSAPPRLDWSGPIELLTVGRIEQEKNPLLLVDALAELNKCAPGRYRLAWVGEGRLRDETVAHARARGIADLISFRGYIPFSERLLTMYREAHAFVHVATTEAAPQVLTEAMACGTPIVATDVGGVRAVLGDGQAGLLVPPRNAAALAEAISALGVDQAGRVARASEGLRIARRHTLDAESARAARFIKAGNADD